MSFVVILIMWGEPHELLRMLERINYPVLFANGLLLLTVTFVPFPTAVLASISEHGSESRGRLLLRHFLVNGLVWNLLFSRWCGVGCCAPRSPPERSRGYGKHTTPDWPSTYRRDSRPGSSRGSVCC